MRPLYSILYMTIDRYPDCIVNLNKNIANSGVQEHDIEVLWADNGSKDPQVINDMMALRYVSYQRINRHNEGISRTLNQLMLRASGKFIVQLGNDYRMPSGWLDAMGTYAAAIPGTGMVGIAWCDHHQEKENLTVINKKSIYLNSFSKPLFGVKLKTRDMLNEVGAFDEKLHPYGLEDSDYHHRACLAGFKNYYIAGLISEHRGNDFGEKTEYRMMKDASLKANTHYFSKIDYERHGYYRPWPAMD